MYLTLSRYGLCASVLSLVSILSIVGCGPSSTKDDSKGAATAHPSKSDTGGNPAHGPQYQPAKPGAEADPGVSAELAKLPPEEQALAKKQKVCPVTDAPLGSMGVPVKVTLKGRTVFLCCEGCEEELKKNADKYLAKLDHPETK